MKRPYTRRLKRTQAEPEGIASIKTADPVLRQLYVDLYRRGFMQQDIAEALGVTRISMSRWKHGHSSPSILAVNGLAEILGYRIVLEKIETTDAGIVRTGG